jgi:hypothetical protein
MLSIYEVKDKLRVKTTQGIKVFLPGEFIKLPTEKASSLVTQGKLSLLPPADPAELIANVIREIEKTYASGAVRWCQRERPDWWKRIMALEEGINKTAKNSDIPHLEALLQQWREEIASMMRAFIEAGVKSKGGFES